MEAKLNAGIARSKPHPAQKLCLPGDRGRQREDFVPNYNTGGCHISPKSLTPKPVVTEQSVAILKKPQCH
jgi:hypothetical protein